MKTNVGKVDLILRLIIAAVIFGAGLHFGSWWGLVGLVPLITALVRVCPLYTLLGIRTCPADKRAE